MDGRILLTQLTELHSRLCDPQSHDRFLLSLEFVPRELKLSMFWLPPSLQKKGLGTKIMGHIFQIAHQQQIPTISIEPRPGSEGFWKKLGFESIKPSYWACRVR